MMAEKLHHLMFVGTGSDVGKSVINAAFCRILKQDGYSPAPFKAQNMSLNSFPTPDGLEIGRAQAVQAEACGIECMVEMNPVLLKPTSYLSSQVVLNGKPIGNQTALEYFEKTDRNQLFNEAMKSFKKLEQLYNPVVIEGAGSISEINLWKKDITNMRVASEANAATFLIADIDRGGIFGSIYGTILLLPENERKLIKGLIINKFRGEAKLFEDGKKMLEDLTGIPVISIIPYFRDIFIDDEDSVILDKKINRQNENRLNIAVVLLPHMSNFTDFNVLERVTDINLFYTNQINDLQNSDIIILPGSKNTIADLQYLRKNGFAKAIINAHENGKCVYGICGGFQMMGREIHDPYQVEGDINFIPGLGILPVKTILTREKTTVRQNFYFRNKAELCSGYEIHMGETVADISNPLNITTNGNIDGYFLNSQTWGTYMHGIFDNSAVINDLLQFAKKSVINTFDYKQFKESQYNKLAELVRQNTNMDCFYKVIKINK